MEFGVVIGVGVGIFLGELESESLHKLLNLKALLLAIF